jgi:hypothetical protein
MMSNLFDSERKYQRVRDPIMSAAQRNPSRPPAGPCCRQNPPQDFRSVTEGRSPMWVGRAGKTPMHPGSRQFAAPGVGCHKRRVQCLCAPVLKRSGPPCVQQVNDARPQP